MRERFLQVFPFFFDVKMKKWAKLSWWLFFRYWLFCGSSSLGSDITSGCLHIAYCREAWVWSEFGYTTLWPTPTLPCSIFWSILWLNLNKWSRCLLQGFSPIVSKCPYFPQGYLQLSAWLSFPFSKKARIAYPLLFYIYLIQIFENLSLDIFALLFLSIDLQWYRL